MYFILQATVFLKNYCLNAHGNYGMCWFVHSQTMEFNSNIKKLVMMVEVTNTPDGDKQAEDAHQAMLNITIPPSLKYSGVRRQVRPHRGALAPSSHLHRREITKICNISNKLCLVEL